jgi:hypothetical protein
VILVNIWIGAPFFMIMYLAALKSVPDQLYEAAAIDGASWWQRIWYMHAADDAQHHRHHGAVLADRHLRQLRHRAASSRRAVRSTRRTCSPPGRSGSASRGNDIPARRSRYHCSCCRSWRRRHLHLRDITQRGNES